MHTKISKLSELSNTLVDKNKIDSGVLNFASRFKVGSLLRSFSALKEQGYSLIVIITNLIFIRLQGTSINGEVKPGISTIDDNTFSDYPFMHLLYSQLLVCQRVCLQNTVCLICK